MGFGVSFFSADPPQPRLKELLIICQAKGPELVIGEINTERVFLPDPGKFRCQLEGYLVVIEEHANNILRDRFTRERLSHVMQDRKDVQEDGDMRFYNRPLAGVQTPANAEKNLVEVWNARL